MKLFFEKTDTNQKGQMLIIVLLILGFVIVNTLFLLSGSLNFSLSSLHTLQSNQAQQLAEAGIDKAVASLNANPNYSGDPETQLGPGSFMVSITSKDPSTMLVTSTGYVPNKAKPKSTRTVTIQISKGAGISFVYGMLIGNGGISMGNTSTINGSVYANGNISGGNNEIITGDVYVAGGTQPTADQQSDCSAPNCVDYQFGRNVAGENRQFVAQSFSPTTTSVLNKVSLKLKKVGSPANPTVRIMGDNAGSPNKSNVIATGNISANLVSTNYGFVDVTFNISPALTANTPYWIMIASASLDNSNYWVWSEDTLQGYTRGSPKWSSDWQARNPVWTGVLGDMGFKTWMGGVATSVSMGNGSVIQGSAHANTIQGVTINKDAYYQVISNSVVKGSLNPGSADPPPLAMPISDQNITDWESDAAAYGTRVGDVTGCPATLGPGKIVGNVTTDNNCTITVTTPIWITGNLTFGNSTIFKMDPSLGGASGVIIIDGTTLFQNSDDLRGTGVTGSYLTALSTYNSQSNGIAAINTGNSSITGILYAPYGIITLANNANFKEVVAWQINMGTGTILTYDSGLISTVFSAGPSGSFSVIKGTYQLK